MLNERRSEGRAHRQKRVRRRVRGSAERPRLCVFRSARHIYVQVIVDDDGRTVVAASSLSSDVRDKCNRKGNVASAREVGDLIARRCLEKKISQVIFDRNGFRYHGRVRALAEAAREAGLQF